MRRLLLAILVATLFSCSLFAASVVGYGTGSSETAALESAREDLVSQFTINVTALSISSVHDDSTNSSSSSYSALSLQSTGFNLLGAQEETSQNEDGTYSATCTLPDSSAQLYEVQLNNLYSTINNLYGEIDSESDFEVQKNTYLRLIAALREYEINQLVVLKLDPENVSALNPLPVTRAVIENEYQSRLVQEENIAQVEIASLQKQSELGILSTSGASDLEAAMQLLEENRLQQAQMQMLAQKDIALMREIFLQDANASISSIEASASLPDDGTIVIETPTYSELVNAIEANRATLQSFRDYVNNELALMENELENALDDIEERYGDSSSTAKDREMERTRISYEQEANALYSSAFDVMSDIADDSLSYVDQLQYQKFTASSDYSGLTVYIDSYIEAAAIYSGIAELTIGNESIKFYFRIPYEAWTGSAIPATSDSSAYLTYISEAYAWLEAMQDYNGLYTLEVDFTVTTDYSPEYEILFTGYRIIRNDIGQVVLDESVNQKDKLRYDSRTDLDDLSVTYDDLIDESLYVYVRTPVDAKIVREQSLINAGDVINQTADMIRNSIETSVSGIIQNTSGADSQTFEYEQQSAYPSRAQEIRPVQPIQASSVEELYVSNQTKEDSDSRSYEASQPLVDENVESDVEVESSKSSDPLNLKLVLDVGARLGTGFEDLGNTFIDVNTAAYTELAPGLTIGGQLETLIGSQDVSLYLGPTIGFCGMNSEMLSLIIECSLGVGVSIPTVPGMPFSFNNFFFGGNIAAVAQLDFKYVQMRFSTSFGWYKELYMGVAIGILYDFGGR